jgi:hypothetical protein
MKMRKLFLASLMVIGILVLQACGGGSDDDEDHFFLVTNTNFGHVCVDGLDVDADSAAAQNVGAALYYYFGYRGGEQDLNSGNVSCSRAKETGAREPDRIVSLSDYNNVIVPAYNARK